jgi:hypothetical protein
LAGSPVSAGLVVPVSGLRTLLSASPIPLTPLFSGLYIICQYKYVVAYSLNHLISGENISTPILICPWISYVYSCSNYWRDHDTALFILKHLYHDIPEETPTDDPERMPIRLFYVRDPIAERFP